MRHQIVFLGLVLLLSFTGSPAPLAFGQLGSTFKESEPWRREPLRGITGFSLEVVTAGDFEESNINLDQVQVDIEAQLRMAGIQVNNDSNNPMIWVYLTYIPIEQFDLSIISYGVEVREMATLNRTNLCTNVITWNLSGTLRSGCNMARQTLRDALSVTLTCLINDYLAVNTNELD